MNYKEYAHDYPHELFYEYEDELPQMHGDVYDKMFDASIVDGVRLFPYIFFKGKKCFLVTFETE